MNHYIANTRIFEICYYISPYKSLKIAHEMTKKHPLLNSFNLNSARGVFCFSLWGQCRAVFYLIVSLWTVHFICRNNASLSSSAAKECCTASVSMSCISLLVRPQCCTICQYSLVNVVLDTVRLSVFKQKGILLSIHCRNG